MSTIKINTCDKDWFGKDYVFYDKNGNPINILYDEELDQYKGKLYFDQNGSDTFKTLELNLFERIRGFEYQQYNIGTSSNYDELETQKFQLFNTEGINLIGNQEKVEVTKIESVNSRPDYYSKWVYGEKMDLLFPLGTEIKFNKTVFTINSNETYTVVNQKQNAILIITSMDNLTFVNSIGGSINDSTNYDELTVSGVNAIKLYNYIDSDYKNNFPNWSEPNFYTQLFEDQKLSIINSTNDNDKVVGVKTKSLGDNYYSDYKMLVSDLDGDLTIRVTNKTSNFNVYTGNVIQDIDKTITLDTPLPSLLTPGSSFTIPDSILNNKTLVMDSVSSFNNVTITHYSDGGTSSNADQVLYNNTVYHCVQSYTQSGTQSINPLDTNYWTESNFLYVVQNLVYESSSNSDIFLDNNQVDLNYTYDDQLSSSVNLATAFNIHSESFDIVGAIQYIDPLGNYGVVKSKYPTDYLDVKFFIDKQDTFSGSTTDGTNFSPTGYTFSYDPTESTDILVKLNDNTINVGEDYLSAYDFGYFSNSGTSSSVDFESLDSNTGLYWKEINATFGLTPSSVITIDYTTEVSIKEKTIERIIEVNEELNNENRTDLSVRNERSVVVTDIDEYGFKVTINEQVYNIESTIIYDGSGDIDLSESIDETLKSWVIKWSNELEIRGIYVRSQYFGNNNLTVLHNSLFIQGYYPNVKTDLSVVVGTTADFHFPDQSVIIHKMGDIGSQFRLTINNRSYIQSYETSITNTLSSWVTTHTEVLNSLGIYVNQYNQTLEFNKKEDFEIEIIVNVGKQFLPGIQVYEIVEYWKGDEGLIITSNKILQNNNEINFEEECFSTGQITSLNNSEYVLNNQEYNITYLDPDRMILSYQGPFWGTIDNSIVSAFSELAFGEQFELGDTILGIVDNNEVIGEVTLVANNYYQILSNNQVYIIDRTNAFYFDDSTVPANHYAEFSASYSVSNLGIHEPSTAVSRTSTITIDIYLPSLPPASGGTIFELFSSDGQSKMSIIAENAGTWWGASYVLDGNLDNYYITGTTIATGSNTLTFDHNGAGVLFDINGGGGSHRPNSDGKWYNLDTMWAMEDVVLLNVNIDGIDYTYDNGMGFGDSSLIPKSDITILTKFESGTASGVDEFGFTLSSTEMATPIYTPPSSDTETGVTYIEVSNSIVDVDYFNSNYNVSIVSTDEVNFIQYDNTMVSLDSPIGLSSSSIKQIINPFNNLLFILSDDYVTIVDPMVEKIITKIPSLLSGTGWDIECDYTRGDVYVSYQDNDRIMIIGSDLSWTSYDYYPSHFHGKMTYNKDEDMLYIFSRINTAINAFTDKVLYRVDLTNNTTRDTGFLISGGDADFIGYGTGEDGYLGDDIRNLGTIFYNEFSGSCYVNNQTSLHLITDTGLGTLEDLSINTDNYYSVTLDPSNKYFWILNSNSDMIALGDDDTIVRTVNISTYGYMIYNPNDSNIYISTTATDNVVVFSTYINSIFYTYDLNFVLNKLTYNYYKKSLVGINFGESQIVDIETEFIYNDYKSNSNAFQISLQYNNVSETSELGDTNYGSLSDGYTQSEYLLLKTREYIRKPRKNYETTGSPQVDWEFKWKSDSIDDIFMFDISGNHLPISGSYAYIGEKPIDNPVLKTSPNMDLTKVDKGYAQQTVFESLTHTLDYNDSESNISFVPEGIQTSLGFNSKIEGVTSSTLFITQYEDIEIMYPSYDSYTSITHSTVLPSQIMDFTHNYDTGYGEITLSQDSTDRFDQVIDLDTFILSLTNLEVGHLLKLYIRDNVNDDPYISTNDNIEVKIVELYQRKLIVSYTNLTGRVLDNESSEVTYNDDTLYLDVTIEVNPKKILTLDIYGQTEIEDIRYKTELKNTGKLINTEDIFIFKEYDLLEGGVDWNYMNNKRREMLTVRNDIYNYIGSYRSLINAINFFGYNDLELYEYFRNIDMDSPNFDKLSKVEIPDIFDNSTEGWTENYRDYLYPNKKYEETKLFNLSYNLTDFDGNRLSTYSLEEVIIKLQGLKKWLEKNIVPITHKILDITGRVDFRDDSQIFHTSSAISIFNIFDEITPIDFNLNETYVLPVQSGSTVYNNVLDFSVGSTSSMSDYFTLDIRTYKTYEEWEPFTNYPFNSKVLYYGKIYNNVLIDSTAQALGQDPTNIKNTNNNPRLYENSETWSSTSLYKEDDIVEFERKYYKFSLQTESANYLPWEGSVGTCLTGTPSTTNGIDDNFYTDLLDRIGQEETTPNYWKVSEDNVNSNFDIVDLFKINYPNDWCDLIDRNEVTINLLGVDMINLPSDSYLGTKPETLEEAYILINIMIDDYLETKTQYKFKYMNISPYENRLLDNSDFILWDDITEWEEIDLEPVQKISEYRSGNDMLLPFNFTLDTQIDPYVVIECRSDNGYGQIKNIKKSYEIKFNADSNSVLIKTIR